MYTMHTRDILQPLRVARDRATHGAWPSVQQRLSWRHGPGGPTPDDEVLAPKWTMGRLLQGSLSSESSLLTRTSLRPAVCPLEVRSRTARSRRKREKARGA
jgi:hypothetical protein